MNIKMPKCIFESAQICRAKNDVRYYLNGICVLPDMRVAATNGHVMLVGGKASVSSPLRSAVILDVQKAPTKNYDHVIINTKTLVATFRSEHDITQGVSLVKLVDGNFPEVDRVINMHKPQSCDKVGFNGNYLSVVGKISALFNKKYPSVTLEISGSTGPAKAIFTNPYGDAGIFIVMPMRID